MRKNNTIFLHRMTKDLGGEKRNRTQMIQYPRPAVLIVQFTSCFEIKIQNYAVPVNWHEIGARLGKNLEFIPCTELWYLHTCWYNITNNTNMNYKRSPWNFRSDNCSQRMAFQQSFNFRSKSIYNWKLRTVNITDLAYQWPSH